MRDYKNPAWIVQEFNKCTLEGQRYKENRELDNEVEMYDALRRFGTDLGMISEWTIRYLLYRYDGDETDLYDDDNFYFLWNKLCQGSLLESLKQLGFSCDSQIRKDVIANKNIRDLISNLPKHIAKVDSILNYWNNCCLYYDDLYRLINNFIVSDKTEALRTLTTGYAEWEEIFKLAGNFSKNSDYKYFLIIDRPNYNNKIDFFRIPWSVIIDFDFDSDKIGGLQYEFQHIETSNFSENYVFNNKVNKVSSGIHWVRALKYNDNNEKPHDRNIANKIDKQFNNFIDSYHSHNPEPAIVIISMNDSNYSRSLNEILRKISSAYYNESAEHESDVRFFLLSNSSIQVSQEFEADHILYAFNMNINQLLLGAKHEIVSTNISTGNYLIPAKTDEQNFIEIDKDSYQRLLQFAELIYVGIENTKSNETMLSVKDFYMGFSHVTWKMLADKNSIMIPSIYNECKKRLEQICSKSGNSRIKFYYKRGMGGTTLLRKLAFDMHEKFPTILLRHYTVEDTADEIEKLYIKCKLPIIIFADSNYLYNEEIDKIHAELKSKTFSFVIVHLIGTIKLEMTNNIFPTLGNMSNEDYNNMKYIIKESISTENEGCCLKKVEIYK